MKTSKKPLSLILSLCMLMSVFTVSAFATGDYTIVSPYADVVWDGENAWGAYKGSLHSHTTYSDADIDLATMVKEYYNQDYDFLANADHGVTGVEWNKAPGFVPLYYYNSLLGNKVAHLTDEEYEELVKASNGVGKTGRNAIANMITNGESQIEKVVAVMEDGSVGSPCGACREYMMQLDKDSEDIEILTDLVEFKTVRLKELIPDWWGRDRFNQE